VDDVVFDAPVEITEEFLASLNIQVVVKGPDPAADDDPDINSLSNDVLHHNDSDSESEQEVHRYDPYRIPREKGIMKVVDVGRRLTGL